MRKKHQRVLEDIFTDPVSASIEWRDVESMLGALGAEITQGKGSRVRIMLNGVKHGLHTPHPEKEMDKGAIRSLRTFLENAGVQP